MSNHAPISPVGSNKDTQTESSAGTYNVPASPPARVLVIDDEPANVRLLEIILTEAGYSVMGTTDPLKSVGLFNDFQPDVILVDLMMPAMDGFAVIAALKFEMSGEVTRPIIVLTSDVTRETKYKALRQGANDFLTKPFDHLEVLLRISNLLYTRSQAQLLERWVEARTQQLEDSHREMVDRLSTAAEFRDDETGQHTKRVGVLSSQIASVLGWSAQRALLLAQAAQLHDIGKIGVPDRILLKPGPLTPEEFATMKKHTAIGAEILVDSSAPVLVMAEQIVRYHHERWDGKGYDGLAGEEIPLVARIVCVADCFDAILSDRPYRAVRPRERAIEEIRNQSGAQFDPQVVAAFLTVMDQPTF